MHNYLKILVLIGLFFPPVFAAQGKEYVVSQHATNAKDSNPGTASKPFKSIDKGLSVLKPGDKLLIVGSKDKEHAHAVYDRAAKHGINLNQKGAASKPISIIAHGFVTLRGNGSMHGINLDNAAHYYVRGFKFENFKKASEGFNPSSHIHIEDCEFTKTKETGMRLREWSDSTLRNVSVHHCAETGLFLKSCKNVLLDNVHSIANSDGQGSAGDGDGYTTHYCTGITFINCSASKNSEDGFDLTGDHVLINCKAMHNNTCNIKLWRRDGNKFKENMTYMLGCLLLGSGEANLKISNGAGLYMSHSIVDQAGEEGIAFRENHQTPVNNYIGHSIILNSKRFGIDRQNGNPLEIKQNVYYTNAQHLRGIDIEKAILQLNPQLKYDKDFNASMSPISHIRKLRIKKEATILKILEDNGFVYSDKSRVGFLAIDPK